MIKHKLVNEYLVNYLNKWVFCELCEKMSILWIMWTNQSIGISDSFRTIWWIKNSGEHSDFIVAHISHPEVLGFLRIWQLHQKSHYVISTCIWCLIPFSETWIMVLVFHVRQTAIRASIVLCCSVMTVSVVASEPFLKSHCAHNVVIGHWVKTVESWFDFLLWTDTALECCCDSCVSESSPVHDLLLFKPPWLEKQCVNIIRFDELIFHWSLVKEEHLWMITKFVLCWQVWTNPWVDTFPRRHQFWV